MDQADEGEFILALEPKEDPVPADSGGAQAFDGSDVLHRIPGSGVRRGQLAGGRHGVARHVLGHNLQILPELPGEDRDPEGQVPGAGTL